MRYYMGYLLLVIGFATISGCKKDSAVQKPPADPLDVRVSGYIYSDYNWNSDLKTDLSLLTDLNLAFINPDTEGEFPLNEQVEEVIARAHAKNVRVYASIGGGSAPPHFKSLLEDDSRTDLISNLSALVDDYDFDGIDVDLEGDFITADYADFISELSSVLKSKDKLMTAALATWNGNVLHDSTLAKFDYINVMSYDATGVWDPANPGPHSPFEMAQNDAKYYIQQRNIPAAKILVGLPFYGYIFENGAASYMDFRNIVSAYPGAENKDMVETAAGGKIYYNGIPTIQKKVQLAADLKAAGVMIWELTYDAPGDKSLLKAINDLR
ncbi:MAG: hypothetical protein EOP49_06510 [Sphingobacteriales bacterium]|nr:MAG: hypothetical protein EOP49_06510 [Sphingobacteriales bacterium]